MKLTEKTLALLSLAGIIGTIFLVPGTGILFVWTTLFLSMIYFYFSFALFNGIRLRNILKKESYLTIPKKRIIGAIGAGLALSAGLFGILFKFQSWPGASVNLYVGLVTIIAVSIVAIIKYRSSRSNFYPKILKRTTLVLVLILTLILLPNDTLLDFKYRNYPAYLKALKDYRSDPNNEELQRQVEDEREKMYWDQAK
jgi:hypothetical protein